MGYDQTAQIFLKRNICINGMLAGPEKLFLQTAMG